MIRGTVTAGRYTIIPDDVDCYIHLDIGSFTSIASGLKIVSGQHPPVQNEECVSTFPFLEHGWGNYTPSKHNGYVYIGNDVWIGQDVSILDGVEIGDGAIVGANSVVTKNVAPYTLVAGNPALLKKYRFPEWVRLALLDIRWWEWNDETIKQHLPLMTNVYNFIREY